MRANLMERGLLVPEELQPASLSGEPRQALILRLPQALHLFAGTAISSQKLTNGGDTLPPLVFGYKAPSWGVVPRDLTLFLTLCAERRQQNKI